MEYFMYNGQGDTLIPSLVKSGPFVSILQVLKLMAIVKWKYTLDF